MSDPENYQADHYADLHSTLHWEQRIKQLEQQNAVYREALEKIAKEPAEECGRCNLDGHLAKEVLRRNHED
jgi:hypothetical protein